MDDNASRYCVTIERFREWVESLARKYAPKYSAYWGPFIDELVEEFKKICTKE
jgi:hypothetical protein